MRADLSDEELVALIKEGQNEHLPELWGRCKYVIKLLSLRHAGLLEKYRGIEMDDFMQCGYFAMLDAVKNYSPEKGYKFVSYLKFPFKKQIYATIGLKREYVDKKLKWAFRDAPDSLNTSPPQSEDIEKMDLLQDESTDTIQEYEYKEIREIIATALGKLGNVEQAAIIGRYYHEKTQTQLVDNAIFFRVKDVENAEARAMRILRKDQTLHELYHAHYCAMEPPPPIRRTPESIAVTNENQSGWLQRLTREMEDFLL